MYLEFERSDLEYVRAERPLRQGGAGEFGAAFDVGQAGAGFGGGVIAVDETANRIVFIADEPEGFFDAGIGPAQGTLMPAFVRSLIFSEKIRGWAS